MIVFLIAAWFIIGALPRLREDSARRLPAIRAQAFSRANGHAEAARKAKQPRGPEWYGWTAAGSLMFGAEAARYLVSSAWHGWGDHRRRATTAWRGYRARAAAQTDETEPSGEPSPDGPGHGTEPAPEAFPEPATVPPAGGDAAAPEDTAGTVPAAPQPQPAPREEPAIPPASAPNVRPIRPAINGGPRMTAPPAEAANLEMAVQVAERLITECQREMDAAQAERVKATAMATMAEGFGASLAAAGVSGPLMDALAAYAESAEAARNAAEARIAAADAALSSAKSAREGLKVHEAAADALAATGGAADQTAWYVPGGAARGA